VTPAEALDAWPKIELLYSQGEIDDDVYHYLREMADQERKRIAASSCFFLDDCVDRHPPNVQSPDEASTAPLEEQDAPPPPQEEPISQPAVSEPKTTRKRSNNPTGRPTSWNTELALKLGAAWGSETYDPYSAARRVGIPSRRLYRWLLDSYNGDPRYKGLHEAFSECRKRCDSRYKYTPR
jgi:hypothetical protein